MRGGRKAQKEQKIKFDTILQFGNESNTFFPLIYGVRGSGID